MSAGGVHPATGLPGIDALPHRPPFRFLSNVLELVKKDRGTAVWQVTGQEAFFQGHFPGEPIVPGTLLAEALAQLSGLVWLFPSDDTPRDHPRPSAKLVHVDVRFKESIVPPAEILLHSRYVGNVSILHEFEVEARVGARVAARGRLTLAQVEAQDGSAA